MRWALTHCAMQSKVDSSGLVNITGLRDWARKGGGGHNAEGNALYYKALVNSATLATWLNKTDQAEAWAENATIFKQTYNDAFWLEDAGMYRDNSSTTLTPQACVRPTSFFVLLMFVSSGCEQHGYPV